MFKKIATYTLFIFLLLRTTTATSAEISFTAEVSTNKVALGSSLQLILTINGATKVGDVSLPPFDGFDVNYVGPSTHVSIVNGKFYSSKSFTYSLIPQKTGTYVIQELSANINGTTYSTEQIEIEVVDSSSQISPQSQGGTVSLSDKINLVLRVPKREVYINEPLPVKIMLLVRDLSVRDIQFPSVNNIGFMVGEFQQPRQYKQIIEGVRYDIVEFDTVVYPTRTGELTLGPSQLDCNLVMPSSQQKSLGGLFNDEFFNAFFDRAEKRPVTLQSETVTINVLDLPEEGRPKHFSGAVGDYAFEASATPSNVKVGDPVTLRMKIKGRGNLKAIEFPEFNEDADFKIYQPNIKEETNVKVLEQVIIPKSDSISEVPPIEFSFFNPQIGKYNTIQRGPFPLNVSKLEGVNPSVFNLPSQVDQGYLEDEELGEDIVFIKEKIGRLSKTNKDLVSNPIPYILIILTLMFWLAGYVYYKWTHRLATDKVFAQKLKAPREARQRLNEAKHNLESNDVNKYYDSLFKTLTNYLASKFQLPVGAISCESIKPKLKQGHEDILNDISEVLKQCDTVRYASANISDEEMKASLLKTKQIIDTLERHYK